MKAHCIFLPLTALSPAPLGRYARRLARPDCTARTRLETGRLDDVFGALTGKARPAAAPFHATGMENDKGRLMMRALTAITAREFAGYFTTPLAFVFIIVFLLANGLATFIWALISPWGRPI